MSDLARYLSALQRAGFYGDVTLKFERGRVVLVNPSATIKPADLPSQTAAIQQAATGPKPPPQP